MACCACAGSGTIGFDELYEFIHGKRHSLDRRYAKEFMKNKNKTCAMALELPPGATYTLFDLVWDMDTFRTLLALTLDKYNLTSATLLKAWDDTGDGALCQTEFMQKVKSTFFRGASLDLLWKMEVSAVAQKTFHIIAGKADSGYNPENKVSNRKGNGRPPHWLLKGFPRIDKQQL